MAELGVALGLVLMCGCAYLLGMARGAHDTATESVEAMLVMAAMAAPEEGAHPYEEGLRDGYEAGARIVRRVVE